MRARVPLAARAFICAALDLCACAAGVDIGAPRERAGPYPLRESRAPAKSRLAPSSAHAEHRQARDEAAAGAAGAAAGEWPREQGGEMTGGYHGTHAAWGYFACGCEPYHELSAADYDRQQRSRILRGLRKRAASLGFELVDTSTGLVM